MPMPEMNPQLAFMMETKSDQLNELVNSERQACYAAGKADALPPWPPEDGAKFLWDDDFYMFSVSKYWMHKNFSWDRCDSGSQAELTAAYLLGELKKLKEADNADA